ncbi:S-formylglutathione hydrolase, partial [Phytophthora palmivora]
MPVIFYLKKHVAAGRYIANTDTSQRDVSIFADEDDWNFSTGTGFSMNVTTLKYRNIYRMYLYVIKELSALITANFPDHSMGGYDSLVLGICNLVRYLVQVYLAFVPILYRNIYRMYLYVIKELSALITANFP